MNLVIDMPLSSVLDAIGWAVVHFLWQGVVIGALAFLAISSLHRRSASERYSAALFALVCCAAAFLITLAIEINGRIVPSAAILTGSSLPLHTELASPPRLMNIIAWIWAIGAGTLGTRIFFHWLLAQRLKTLHVSQPDQHWLGVFASLTRELGLTRPPRFLQSAVAEVPMVVGCFAPVVLVPVSAFTSLTPEQLKAVLAHELWHIRRRDPWVNAFQIAIETILFFHPAVWWLSSQVRLEREYCCDDAAVRSAGNPRVFAEALARLETLRIHIPTTALSSNGGPLMNRIARMIGASVPSNRTGPGWFPAAALGAGLLVLSALSISHAAMASPQSDESIVQALRGASGTMSQDDARALYSALAYKGSEAEARALAMLSKASAQIDADAAAGKLTTPEATARKEAVRTRIERQQQLAFDVDVLGKSTAQARLDMTAAMFQADVKAGKISQKEADSRIATVRQQLMSAPADEKPLGVLKAPLAADRTAPQPTQADFDTLNAALRDKVAAGVMTPDDAKAARSKLAAAQKQPVTTDATVQPASAKPTRAEFEKLHTTLKAKVAAGEITQNEMDAQIKAYREQLIKANPR